MNCWDDLFNVGGKSAAVGGSIFLFITTRDDSEIKKKYAKIDEYLSHKVS
jgi:hypothetical protein|tara:strand:- start:366 stop:515 length:150 start_codon:yes stop_codon:yes gene_type:complete